MYKKRSLAKKLKSYIELFPVTLVTGPRQSGKSTILKNELPWYTYLTFDDYKIANFFRDDPEGFFKKYDSKVIIDEVQKEPTIFNYLKKSVDEKRNFYGQYILSGSNQFTMLNRVTESLAGRIGILELLPFQASEIDEDIRTASIFKGGYPELLNRKYKGDQEWYSSYIDTYLNKDVRQIANIGDLRYFRKFVEILSSNTSHILNMSTYAKELGVSVSTIKRWISVLEASYIIFLLSPYHNNLKKRVIKSPKVYFYDTGLVSYITGIQNQKLFEFGPMGGEIFETYIVSEVMKFLKHSKNNAKISFFRDSNQVEVDLIIEGKESVLVIEIKKGSSSNRRMVRPLELFLKKIKNQGTKQAKAYLVYQGENFSYGDSIEAVHYTYFFNQVMPRNFN